MEPGDSPILTHLQRGALEYCVLALLDGPPRYGLDLARRLGTGGLLMTSEGTLYPLLARLRKNGLVETTWAESPSGPPRRYYALTPEGRKGLAEFRLVWAQFRDEVDTTLEGALP